MKNISSFIAELESLKEEMGKGSCILTTVDKRFVCEQKLSELQRQNEQLQGEIDRQIEDFFAYLNMKQANIEALNGLKEYVETEIKKLEQSLKELKVSE